MGKYSIEFKRSAVKEIKQLPKKDIKKILEKIFVLADNPRPVDCKKLSAREKYRIRCGRYRILYSIYKDVLKIYVVKVAHRSAVYRF